MIDNGHLSSQVVVYSALDQGFLLCVFKSGANDAVLQPDEGSNPEAYSPFVIQGKRQIPGYQLN